MDNHLNQLPLIPKEKNRFDFDIKSPIFTPEPGWGGQLKNWLSNRFSSRILPVISFGILAIGVYLLLAK